MPKKKKEETEGEIYDFQFIQQVKYKIRAMKHNAFFSLISETQSIVIKKIAIKGLKKCI